MRAAMMAPFALVPVLGSLLVVHAANTADTGIAGMVHAHATHTHTHTHAYAHAHAHPTRFSAGLYLGANATKPRPPPPPLYAPMPLHPFYQYAPAGDVDGVFELNGTYHIFKCCDWHHLTAPTAAGPWTDLGTSGSPARDGGYISGSVTVVNGVPRVVMPHFPGNPKTSHCCAGADGKPHKPPWRYCTTRTAA